MGTLSQKRNDGSEDEINEQIRVLDEDSNIIRGNRQEMDGDVHVEGNIDMRLNGYENLTRMILIKEQLGNKDKWAMIRPVRIGEEVVKQSKSYANAAKTFTKLLNNELNFVPTGLNELGNEVVVFDKELVEIGSKKWRLTLCGYLVGLKMSLPEVRYHLRRMWGRYGLKEIMDNPNRLLLFKFGHEARMDNVIEMSPWMVNGKPLMVQKWNPNIGMEKTKHNKIPLWVKFTNVPMERPEMGPGRTEYAKILTEISVEKGFKESVEFVKSVMTLQENKYNVLVDVESVDLEVIKMLKDIMIVDQYLNKRIQPNCSVIRDWSQDMIKYFKRACEADREKERQYQDMGMNKIVEGIVKDVLEDDSLVTWNLTNPWVILGDFNVTLKIEEQSSGSSIISNDMHDFIDCVNTLKVEDAHAVFHPYVVSNHSPVVFTIPQAIKKKTKSFRFSNFIAEKPKLLAIANEGWKVNVSGIQMFKVVKRLKYLKTSLKKLSWKNGDVFDRVVQLKKKLKEAQALVDSPHNNQVKEFVVTILKEYHEAVINKEKLWFQKANIEWLCEGDRNNSYFHKVVKGKRRRNRIVDDISCVDEIFTKKLSSEQALMMVREVINEEVKYAIFDIRENKASGLDGYTSSLFKKSWHIVRKYVCKAVKNFFDSGKLLGEINAIIISIVPKVKNVRIVSDFRPISCCNVLYKCINNILTERMKDGLNSLVNHNQCAFIQGRQIHDNIIIAQELLKCYNRNSVPKICSLKIDIAKAYDNMTWEYLINVLIMFCFHDKMVN
ncbi:RNA-directed DNA polymerase, eukaryota, reverse transcriptase zinc-binding domain protein [Tanacetum coccineum]